MAALPTRPIDGSGGVLTISSNDFERGRLMKGGGRSVTLTSAQRPGRPNLGFEHEFGLCPCGEELLAAGGKHVLGSECCSRVQDCVRKYFNAAGRYAHYFEDAVQDCYAKLADPRKLAAFNVPPGRDRADAFRGWLYIFVKRTSLNRLEEFGIRKDYSGSSLEALVETGDSTTAAQLFARECIREIARQAVSQARRHWQAKGAEAAERFEVLLEPVLTDSVDYDCIRKRLGIGRQYAVQLKCELVRDRDRAARRLVEDTLHLEPGLDRATIEQRIDQEIDDLFETAYPGESERWLDFRTSGEDEENPAR
jgi:hypothetical protein